MRTANVADAVDDCAFILEFLSQAVAAPINQSQQFSSKAQDGLSLILIDIGTRLSAASAALSNKQTEMEVM